MLHDISPHRDKAYENIDTFKGTGAGIYFAEGKNYDLKFRTNLKTATVADCYTSLTIKTVPSVTLASFLTGSWSLIYVTTKGRLFSYCICKTEDTDEL